MTSEIFNSVVSVKFNSLACFITLVFILIIILNVLEFLNTV